MIMHATTDPAVEAALAARAASDAAEGEKLLAEMNADADRGAADPAVAERARKLEEAMAAQQARLEAREAEKPTLRQVLGGVAAEASAEADLEARRARAAELARTAIEVTVVLQPLVAQVVREMVKTGLWGTDPEKIVEQMMLGGIRQAMLDYGLMPTRVPAPAPDKGPKHKR